MSYRGPGKKRSWRYRKTSEEGNCSSNVDHDKPPPGLRGKEIGLWKYKRSSRRKYENPDEGNSSRSMDRTRRPPGLRGKAIGLWYAQRNKMFGNDKKTEDEWKLIRKKETQVLDRKPLGTILLSKTKKNNITKLLNETASMYPSTSKSYEHLEETDFKHEFLQHISGSIIQKLRSSTYNASIFRRVSPYHGSSVKLGTDEKKEGPKILLSHKNDTLDDLFLKELEDKVTTSSYKKMLAFRNKLPSMKMKDEILDLVNKNQIVVISGETGCGKTTQVAQFILDDYIRQGRGSECRIICTQPRRISAISVAERVAQERVERLGISAGYQIRMEKVLPRSRGSILYCTTGVLLKFMEGDPSLSSVSHLILDEIHERDVTSDFLITVLKDVISFRSDIKVILMSATLNAEAFSKYYDNAPHINIPGFTFPVTDYYLEYVLEKTKYKFRKNYRNKQSLEWWKSSDYLDYIAPYLRNLQAEKSYSREVIQELELPASEQLDIQLIYELLKYICSQENDDGAILVFVPGFAEIKSLSGLIEKYTDFPPSKYITVPLHSQLPTIDQKQIFLPPPAGMRKIIIATNIAETSITIEDVTTVIDCGYIKMSNLDPETGIETLNSEWVSCANASQRRGRAGRVKPGVCYHLFTKARQLLLDKFLKPEVLRKRLDDVILQLKMLQLGDAKPFLERLMDPPESTSVTASVNLLQRLGALDDDELLTPLGLNMAKLSVGAQCAKMLLMGALFSCLDPILSVAASLGFKDAFRLSMDAKESDKKRVELSKATNSDHLLMHFAIRGFEESRNQYGFCRDYYLSAHILQILQDMRKQFAQLLYDMKFIKSADARHPANNYNSKNLSLVKAVITSGLYPNVAIKWGRSRFRSTTHEKMELHPKSVLRNLYNGPSPLVVYYIRLKSKSIYIHDGTYVFPLSIIFFGDQFKALHNNQEEDSFIGISINGTMRFLCTESTVSIVEQLRRRLNQILESKISNPGFVDWTSDTPEIQVLRTVAKMITSEDMEDQDLSDYDDI